MTNQNQSPKQQLGFPKAQLSSALNDVTDYTLIDGHGRIWSSYSDPKRVHTMLKQSVEDFTPATT